MRGRVPDYCSVNLNEEDAVEVIALLQARGIGVAAGLWDRRDARRWIGAVPFSQCVRVLIEMTSNDGAEAVTEAQHIFDLLPQGAHSRPCCTARKRLGVRQ